MNFNAEEKREIKKIKQDIYPQIDETFDNPEQYLPHVFNNLALQVADPTK